jgi:sugar lactone lactonase YvrE
VLELVRSADADSKLLGVICHGGWVPASAGILKGRTMTCTPGIKDDVVNAGAEYVDRPVVVDGNLVTANIALGRVQQMTRDGQVSTMLEEVDGQRTTSANFVFYDRRGRLWLTCLTREDHWWPAVAHPRPDGFVVLVDERGARIVADGIYATNEARLDPEERYLYVAETMKARILRFPVRPDGSLGEREVFGPDGLGLGGFVDGFRSMPRATCGSPPWSATALGC